ncbi:hypothetical protein SAMN05421829_10239 [Aromatoleum tolulyticum]|uniref:Uncharacterized protein n=1 Tax=Aromatoleum tolulyticum TaxID=34027 RepID=A0A1N6PGR2_9RHOO|nr:hypothetical protein [Aromatoleum tolulyticum]SIQ03548.1 hypothetical protein SAMN05421829_10239 [Aromatoleum tolulyticum]
MTTVTSVLVPSLQDLEETISDFRDASFQSCESVLERLIYQLDEEPMSGFLAAVLPAPIFSEWFGKTQGSVGSMVGSGVLEWPVDRSERVAMQIALVRAIASKQVRFLDFVHQFYYSGRNLSDHVEAFAAKLLEPLLRDMKRLTESRAVPPVLFEAMGNLPPSGDALLDSMLRDACLKFKDPAPKARAEATEKLWDAWERLKSVEVQGNKKLSVIRLLDRASPDPAFRTYLEAEAKTLTEIGNAFHIRHFETDKISLAQPEQFDYLFHRLYALMHFLLFSRQRGDDA